MQSRLYSKKTSLAKISTVFLCIWLGLTSVLAQNITVLGQTNPIIGSISFGDVWAEENIACLGVWLRYSQNQYGVGIFDISDPTKPQRLSTYFDAGASSQNQFEQGVVRNKIGYFASWSGGGVHIVSLTNPVAPLLLSKIDSAQDGFDQVHTMWLERNFLYEAAHVAGITSVKVFDVSDLFAPVYLQDIVTTNTTKVHQMTVANKGTNTILYTSGWGGADNSNTNSLGQTDIWDVSNVGTQPAKWLGRIYSGYNSHSSWPTPDGNTLVVCRETSGGEVRFYDITTPPQPSPHATTNPAPIAVISSASMGIEADIPHNPVIIGHLLFLSWYQNGIQVFNISDRTKPVRVGSFDTYPAPRSASFQGNWGVHPFLGLDKLLLSDIQTGLYILDASAVLTGTNKYPPLLITSPQSQTNTQGQTVTLSTTVTGSALKYQWRFNGAVIPGATDSSFTLNNTPTNASGLYLVVATNAYGSVTSSAAALSVLVQIDTPPSITAQPGNLAVYPEQSATFNVAVVGSAPLRFQWRFNGHEIAGATNASFTHPNVQGEQVGVYSVIVSNNFGVVTSSNALLSLIDSPYLSAVQSTPGARSALISWKTTLPADSQVQFDLVGAANQSSLSAASAGATFSTSSYTDAALKTNHTILLTGLTPGQTYNFQVVSSAGTNHYISGVYQFSTLGSVILDNTNSTVVYAGNWTAGTISTDKYGADYRFATVAGSGTNTATFRPTVTVPGKYDVAIWYPQGGNRTMMAPCIVAHAGGLTTNIVNQQINGGQWFPLGRYSLTAGTNGFVRISNRATNGSVVLADAVRFTYAEDQDLAMDGSVPSWWRAFYFGEAVVNPALDPDGDGYTTAQEYIMGTSPTTANQRLDMDVFRSGQTANILFWPLLGDRTYTLLHRSNLSSGSWEPLPTGAIYPDEYGQGSFTFSITNAAQDFLKLSVQWATNSPAFSGLLATPAAKAFSAYATDPLCGPNRAYVK